MRLEVYRTLITIVDQSEWLFLLSCSEYDGDDCVALLVVDSPLHLPSPLAPPPPLSPKGHE